MKLKDLAVSDALPILREAMARRRLLLFAGSGISVDPPASLPTWDTLLVEFVDFCERFQARLPSGNRFEQLIADSKAQAPKHPARVATVLTRHLKQVAEELSLNVDSAVRGWLLDRMTGANPNRYHTAIIRSKYPYILTTNYDRLLTIAAERERMPIALRTFTFTEANHIAKAIYDDEPCILHLHGSMLDIRVDDIVFTQEDYVRIRRDFPGFTLAVQTLFLRYSVLFVGYGGSDPHMENLAEELQHLFKWPTLGTLPTSYFIIRRDRADTVLSRYKDRLGTQLIVVDDYDQVINLVEELQKV